MTGRSTIGIPSKLLIRTTLKNSRSVRCSFRDVWQLFLEFLPGVPSRMSAGDFLGVPASPPSIFSTISRDSRDSFQRLSQLSIGVSVCNTLIPPVCLPIMLREFLTRNFVGYSRRFLEAFQEILEGFQVVSGGFKGFQGV